MNILLNLTPAQWDWITATARTMNIDPAQVIFRLLELGMPILDRQIRLAPQRKGAKVVRLVPP